MKSTEQLLNLCGLRIICVLLIRSVDESNTCIYRVYISDGGFSDYVGYNSLPQFIRDWLTVRNSFDYAIPSVMFVSGVSLSGEQKKGVVL